MVVNKQGKKVPFRPNIPQTDFLNNIHSRNIILKARQRGFTTLCCIMYLDDCLFNADVQAAVIAHKLDDASIIFRTKVRNVYMDLPAALRDRIKLTQDSQTTLGFTNGSTIRVSTSTRSGTVQWLHVSEYGKICAVFPDKAREIRTGAFPSAEQGTITIESTAEGNAGDFYDKCMDAKNTAEAVGRGEKEYDRLDYKFFFYSWLDAPEYQVKSTVVAESPDDTKYFGALESNLGVKIDQPHRNWWLVTERDLGGDMKREYPATPEEAFEQAIEGAYFADQLAFLAKKGRIGDFPVDPSYPVHTTWDLGRNDDNVIWLWQDIGGFHRFVGFYRNSGEWIGHYIDWLNEWRHDNGVIFGAHYIPHDGDVTTIWTPDGSMDSMQKLKFFPTVVKRNSNKIEAINKARRKLVLCQFDASACKEGLDLLKRYRKQFDERNQVWRNQPQHDEASHVADSFITFADSDHAPQTWRTHSEEPEKRVRYNRLRSRATQHSRPRTFMGT